MNILITGCAGFIGYHLCLSILKENDKKINIVGFDNLNSYYDVNLKIQRLKELKKFSKNFTFYKIDISNNNLLKKYFKKYKFKYVVNLAAQAGVRYSIQNPEDYVKSNINGFFNILNNSKIFKCSHLVYASTSSVYGASNKFPLTENLNTDTPLSFYAATKKSNEVMAYAYSNIYGLPTTGLRFFTVYGVMGRPDMSLFKFTKNIINRKYIDLYNRGNHIRDFTHVSDVVEPMKKLIFLPSKKKIPYEIFNVGSQNPKSLKFFLKIISDKLKIKPKIKNKSMQIGDVYKTEASIKKLKEKLNFSPRTNLKEGINNFIDWYKNNN